MGEGWTIGAAAGLVCRPNCAPAWLTCWVGPCPVALGSWSINTGKPLHRLTSHDRSVTCCCITPNGRLAATGGADAMLYIYDLETGARK